jgi:hypothetical protein
MCAMSERRVIRTYSAVGGGAAPVPAEQGEIRGSTTIVQLLRMFPNGEAARLMSELHWACAHCGGAFHEPLTMAAKRHANDPRAVLDAFRALAEDGPTADQVEQAARKVA